MANSKKLYIFLQDEDLRRFAVAGPIGIRSLDEWLEKGIAARKEGRQVTVIDIFEEYLQTSVQHASSQGFTLVQPYDIVVPPKDRSAEYEGKLPAYAENADRDRVVKILCKGRCRAERWAELDQVYPGRRALKDASMGTFKAKCLRCGALAQDSYNWYR